MKKLLLFSLSILMVTAFSFAQNYNTDKDIEFMHHPKVDTVYKAPHHNEIYWFQGYEPPERTPPDFVVHHGKKTVPFAIDSTCKESDPTACVSLYHYVLPGGGYKWLIRSSTKVDRLLHVVYGQKVGKDGMVINSKTDLYSGEVKDLGYGEVPGDEHPRDVWIIAAHWDEKQGAD
jgi:hypothetical protein